MCYPKKGRESFLDFFFHKLSPRAYVRVLFVQIFAALLHPTQFCVSDPDLVNTILIKEFSNFHDRGFKVDPEVNPLEGHLFLINGEPWRALRNKLSPTFTSGKLKKMYPLMTDCGDHLIKGIDNRSKAGDVELVDLLGCFTTDVIGK
jgi:cytochrome P450